MAHWIVIDRYNTKVYKCSKCGVEYHDCVYSPDEWETCPRCKSIINATISDPEATAVEPTPMKDVVILSIEKYDAMRDDLVKLGKDLEVANTDKENCLDILKKIGIDEDNAKRIIPDTGELIDNRVNPYTLRRKIILSFEMDDDRRV